MLSRRSLLALLASTPLAACQTARQAPVVTADADYDRWYIGSLPDGEHQIPLVDRKLMKPELARQTVAYSGTERRGTILVDIDQRFLYYINGDGSAVRYG